MKFRTVDIIGTVSLVGLSLVGWIGIVGPVRHALDESLRLESAKFDLSISRSKFIQTQNRMRAEIDRVEAELEHSRLRLADMAHRNARSGALTRIATSEGMTLEGTTIGKQTDGRWFQAVPITLEASGSYHQCLQFLRRMHDELPDMEVLGMRLSGNPAAPGESESFRFDLAWYAAAQVAAAD